MLDDFKDMFHIDETSEIEFHKKYDFTFAFERKIILINDKLTSAEVNPLGIIYEKNEEYYFAPLDEEVDINAIVKKFVEKILKNKK